MRASSIQSRVSRYVYRGLAYSDGPALQPSAWVASEGLRLGVWADFVLQPGRNQGRFDEIDLSLERDFDLWGFTLTPSAQLYSFLYRDEEQITGEFLLRLSRPLGPFELFTTHGVDFGSYPGSWFGEIGAGWEWSPLPALSVEAQASLGFGCRKFNDAYFGVAKWAINVASLSAGVSWKAVGPVYLRPHGGVSVLIDPALRGAVDSPTLGFGGIAIGVDTGL